MAGAFRDLDGEVDGETERVMEHERGLAGKHVSLTQGSKLLVKVNATVVERGGETLLLRVHNTLDQVGVLDKVGICLSHNIVDGIDETTQERVLDTQQATMEDGAAEQAAQDVAATLVTGKHSVGDQEVDRTSVVGDDAQGAGSPGIVVVHVGLARDVFTQLDEALHNVAIEEGALMLHDGSHALQAHAGIQIAMGQLGHGAVLLAVELGKDQVPELEETVAIAAGGAIRATAANLFTQIEIDLGARAARAGGSGCPEVVVLAQTGDVVGGNAKLAPHVISLIIIREDGEVQALLGKLKDLGDELVGPCACLLLGDAAEGEVAEHLEEGSMAAVGADDVDIVGAHALLARAGTDLLHGLLALVVLLKLIHASIGEQQGGIIGDQRGAGVQLVAALLKEGKVRRADLGGCHSRIISSHEMRLLW